MFNVLKMYISCMHILFMREVGVYARRTFTRYSGQSETDGPNEII